MSIATEMALKTLEQRVETLEKVISELLDVVAKLQPPPKPPLGLKNGQR